MPTKNGPKPKPVEKRFWGLVRKTPKCWEWIGTTNGKYGTFRINNPRSNVYAHRYSWFLSNGEHPDKFKHVCHHCDNVLCVRPDHLFIGTQGENLSDMWNKGRGYSFFRSNPDWQKNNPRPLRTHCSKGHALIGDNLVRHALRRGRLACRVCANQKQKVDYWKKRGHLG